VRVRFVLTMLALITIAALMIIPTALGAVFMLVLTAPGCGDEDDPAAAGMTAESVTFPSGADAVETPAYFIPAADPNGATVLFIPTGNAGRGWGMGSIAVYHDAGFDVLTYSSRVCRTVNSLGALESYPVADALAYLRTRPEVDPGRIGVHGFSAGGASAILAAALYPEIAAVVAVGNYENFAAQVDASLPGNLGLLAPFFRIAAQTTYRARTGIDWSALDPIGVINAIAPRPILLIYGSGEPGLSGGRAMAAKSGAALVIVPGVGHGGYLHTPEAAAVYTEALVGFMGRALDGAG